MNTPDAKTAANTLAPAPEAMPVQQLMDTMKPEPTMVIESSVGGFGTGSGASPSSNTSTSPAPVTTTAAPH
jgi:hypothetical protein